MTLFISNDDVAVSVTIADCIGALEACYSAAGRNGAAAEPRSVLWSPLGPGRRHALASLSAVDLEDGIAALRVRSDVYVTAGEPTQSRDEKYASAPGSYCGLILVFSIETGELIALAHDGLLQQMRVAATAAVAGRRLARSNSRVLAIIGAGRQARWHAVALATQFRLEEIRVFSPSSERRRLLATELGEQLGVPTVATESASAALHRADIVVTCTNARQPVLDAADIVSGTFVASVRHRAEMDPAILKRSRVFVNERNVKRQLALGTLDSQAAAGIRLPTEALHDYPDLVQVVSGSAPGRQSPAEITYFMNNQGSGLQFAAVGALAMRRVTERGLGRDVPSEWFLQEEST